MNKLYLTAALCAVAIFSCPAKAATYQAGLPCQATLGSIPTRGSDAMDDLLACVGGVWHSLIYGGMPSGGIAAFSSADCPSGWTDIPMLAGRSIVGAGNGAGLTSRHVGDYGGEETHTQSVAEMPSHNHGISQIAIATGRTGYSTSQFILSSFSLTTSGSTATDYAGNGQPFNVMMPWYAMHYCAKQ